MTTPARPKVALAHDFLSQYGGAERVLESLHALFPDAPVYTLLYNRDAMPAEMRTWDIRPHPWLKWLGASNRWFKALFFLYPLFTRAIDLREYDLVISSSSGFIHGVSTAPGATHVCYCHTPMRFVWAQREQYEQRMPALLRPLFRSLVGLVKRWDLAASKGPSRYVANSKFVGSQILQAYGRQSPVLFPPMPLSAELLSTPESPAAEPYFLVVARLVRPNKRVDLAIEAAKLLGIKLKVVGDGADREWFKSLAGTETEFLGKVSNAELARAYKGCTALVVCWEEDFGIAPIEANAFGKPVVAFRAGGLAESQTEGKTALFFDELTPRALAQAMDRARTTTFSADAIREHSKSFSEENFKASLLEIIAEESEGKWATPSQRKAG